MWMGPTEANVRITWYTDGQPIQSSAGGPYTTRHAAIPGQLSTATAPTGSNTVAPLYLGLIGLALGSVVVVIKRILRRHGYPPDKQEGATRTVLEQAELLSQEWAIL